MPRRYRGDVLRLFNGGGYEIADAVKAQVFERYMRFHSNLLYMRGFEGDTLLLKVHLLALKFTVCSFDVATSFW